MPRFGQITDPRVGEKVVLSHGGDMIPSIIREINKSGNKIRLQIVGNKHHRPWLGLHWVNVTDIHAVLDAEDLG